jgi:hypothetical protein
MFHRVAQLLVHVLHHECLETGDCLPALRTGRTALCGSLWTSATLPTSGRPGDCIDCPTPCSCACLCVHMNTKTPVSCCNQFPGSCSQLHSSPLIAIWLLHHPEVQHLLVCKSCSSLDLQIRTSQHLPIHELGSETKPSYMRGMSVTMCPALSQALHTTADT